MEAPPRKKMKMKKKPTVAKQRFDDVSFFFPILSRLPVKSVLRFTCVCRSWNAMIRSSDFVSAHFNHHQIIKKSCPEDNVLIYIQNDDWKTSQVCNFVRENKSSHDVILPLNGSSRVVGVSEGLICLTKYGRIYLWNPLVKSLKRVPTSGGPKGRKDFTLLGFGFAERSGDYRVIKIVGHNPKSFQVGIYSLATNSWRSIQTEYLEEYIFYSWSTVFFEGSIYWLTKRPEVLDEIFDDENFEVLSFDVEEEKFEVMAVLPPLNKVGPQPELVVANGSLVMLQVSQHLHPGIQYPLPLTPYPLQLTPSEDMQVSTWTYNKESLESPWRSTQSTFLPNDGHKNKTPLMNCGGYLVLVGSRDERLSVFDYDNNVGFKMRDLGIYRTSRKFHLISMAAETLCLLDQDSKDKEIMRAK